MSQSPEEIRRDIERTRAQMGDTIDAIEDRVVPGRVIGRRKEQVRRRITGLKEAIMGTADDATSAMSRGTSAVGDTASNAASGVAETASNAASGVAGLASGAADTTAHAASTAVDAVRSAPQAAARQTRGNPLMAGAVAFGAGVLVAYAIPQSERERQAASALKDKAQPVVDKAVEQAKEVGQEVGQHVAEEAKSQVVDLKETAQEAVQEVKEEAQERAEDVKDAAAQGGQQEPAATGTTPWSGTTQY